MKKKILTLILIILSINNLLAQKTKSNTTPQYSRCYTDELYESVTRNNAQLQNLIEQEIKKFRSNKIQDTDQIITIPVVFNVLHTGESIGSGKNLSDAKLIEQIQILNDAYANANNQGVDFKIRFCIARQNVFGENRVGILRHKTTLNSFTISSFQDDDFLIKSNRDLTFPANKYLNIWTANIVKPSNGEIFGYATFPFLNPANSITDGIVLNYKNVGTNNSDNSFGGGKTLIHELGHWLGLWHTFRKTDQEIVELENLTWDCANNNCEIRGDEVCDTEPRVGPAFEQKNTQDQLILSPGNCDHGKECFWGPNDTKAVQNYMDYNYDGCMKFFTQGQKERARQMLLQYREDLVNYNSQIVECNFNDNNDEPDGENCTPNDQINDQLGYRIRNNGGGFGSDVAINNNIVAVADESRGSVKIYKISGCAITPSGSINKYQVNDYLDYTGDTPIQFGEQLKVLNDRIFVTSVVENQRYIVIFKENSSGWYIHQLIKNESQLFAKKIIVRQNELMAIGKNEIVLYKLSDDYYSIFQTATNLLFNNDFNHYNNSVSYNGTYLVANVTKFGNRTNFIFKKGSNGKFNSSKIGEITYPIANLLIDNQNRIYVAENRGSKIPKLYRYTFFNGLLIKINDIDLNSFRDCCHETERIRSMTLQGNILSLSRNGAGITFHDINNNLADIQAPSLENSYTKYWLNPYYAATGGDFNDKQIITYGRNTDSDGNYLTTTNENCNEIYIYKINNILQNATLDIPNNYDNLNICNVPSASLTKGNVVTIGGTCNVTFEQTSGKTIKGETKVVLKKGTKLSSSPSHNGYTTIGTLPFPILSISSPDCSLTGGQIHNFGRPELLENFEYTYHSDASENTENEIQQTIRYKIVPVPVKDNFKISNNLNSNFSIAIYDIYGSKIYESTTKNSNFNINFSNKKQGIYLVKATNQNGSVENLRFVKE